MSLMNIFLRLSICIRRAAIIINGALFLFYSSCPVMFGLEMHIKVAPVYTELLPLILLKPGYYNWGAAHQWCSHI